MLLMRGRYTCLSNYYLFVTALGPLHLSPPLVTCLSACDYPSLPPSVSPGGHLSHLRRSMIAVVHDTRGAKVSQGREGKAGGGVGGAGGGGRRGEPPCTSPVKGRLARPSLLSFTHTPPVFY